MSTAAAMLKWMVRLAARPSHHVPTLCTEIPICALKENGGTLVSTAAAMLQWMVRRVARPRRRIAGRASSCSLNSATGAACDDERVEVERWLVRFRVVGFSRQKVLRCYPV